MKTFPAKNTSMTMDGLFMSNEFSSEMRDEILVITSYPPRECGIATYSQDMVSAINNKFDKSFGLTVCALESGTAVTGYPDEVKFTMDPSQPETFDAMIETINADNSIRMVLIQHEFGLFHNPAKEMFLPFLDAITKPAITVFHTVLSSPSESLKKYVHDVVDGSHTVIVMTGNASDILIDQYGVAAEKINVIPHGTHLVPHHDRDALKKTHQLENKKVLSTFGLLSSGKSIETTLTAMPSIVKNNPDTMFLIIGKTHPGVVREEGERYREMLEGMVKDLGLEAHVTFINRYVSLTELLEYLQLTDIYLFTSKDPHQAVSGTFAYAMSCACAIVSTPIPHAKEVLKDGAGVLIDFQNPVQLAEQVNRLLRDDNLRTEISLNALHRIVSTAWENSALAHTNIFREHLTNKGSLQYNYPAIRMDHIKKMTAEFGMLQFSKINHPDMDSGYTLDDNARALIAMTMHYEKTLDETNLPFMEKYIDFLGFCVQSDGCSLNYVDEKHAFTTQNSETNLEDSNGRAIWALGHFISHRAIMPGHLIQKAESTLLRMMEGIEKSHSPRAVAFIIKGLYYYQQDVKSLQLRGLIEKLADKLANQYRHEASPKWKWFESYLTYANSILPEAMLCAYMATRNPMYRQIALASFDFLLERTYDRDGIKVISNKSWLQKDGTADAFGEQPIDVAYTILALGKFYEVFKDDAYLRQMEIAFSWFMGNNHLRQIIYNPCTTGCYDGLEETHVNLNQGAESTVCYAMARLTVEKHLVNQKTDRQTPEAIIVENVVQPFVMVANGSPQPVLPMTTMKPTQPVTAL